jgi:leucyl aminopeptidase
MVLEIITITGDMRKGCSIAVGVYADGSLSPSAEKIDRELGGMISAGLKKLRFTGKTLFKTCSFVCLGEDYNHIILIGLGDPGREYTRFESERLGAAVCNGSMKNDEEVVVALDEGDVHCSAGGVSAFVALGALLKSRIFDKYKTRKDERIKLRRLTMLSREAASAEKQFTELKNVAEGIFLARLVVSEPANVIYPESLAEIAKNELSPLGVEVEILKAEEMKKLGMNALLAVAQGSQNGPALAVLRWNGGGKSDSPMAAFVGKGVTFDSGGISLKPGDGMHEMRCDMAGSATVLGLLKAAALNRLPVNIVGLMAMVENMPSGSAQRPGDVVKSMSGLTIEVLNTDAEGRMVLADALWYARDRFNPEILIDFATLTGAIVVALGHEFAGLFSNCEPLADQILKSAAATGEKVWRMPMSEHFDDGINSELADMQNIAKPNVRGGSITAAQFLKRFVGDGKWAHIDIAGVETSASEDLFICPKDGATGFGVHLMYDFLCENYAKQQKWK